MISIERLPEPEVLRENKEIWSERFIESGKKRPSSGQYAHEKIRDTLDAMSFGKCFYCECKLGTGEDDKPEVDHYIEVSEHRELAFEWNNLYLSCFGCNRKKLENRQLAVSECLNPCDPNENPADHLTFDGEYISYKNNSDKGKHTIQKYRLHRLELDSLRRKKLQKFKDVLLKIKDRQIDDGGRPMTNKEKEILKRFKNPDKPFSLMFQVHLAALNL